MTTTTCPSRPEHHSVWLDVDLDALAYNYLYIKKQIAPAELIAVVKAYGLGTGGLMAARKLESLGAYMLAVSNFHEGTYLRKHGVKSPILVMNGLLPAQIEIAVAQDLSFFGFDERSLRTADAVGRRLGKRARVHLKVDTGLGRLGFLPEDAPAIRDVVAGLRWVEVEGIASHEATPVKAEHDYFTRMQYEKFVQACRVLDPEHKVLHHFSSSNAVPRLPEVNADGVRCQAIIWGCVHYLPLPWPLKPVASYKARVVQVKDLPAGHNVGYSLRNTTTRPTRLGVVPMGVVDGMKAEHVGGGYVLVRGTPCPIIGVCSCEMMIDVTDVPAPGAEAGDEVVLFGTQGPETLTAIEFGWMGKSSFMSVLALISPRVPRLYWEGGKLIGSEMFCQPEEWEFSN
ncbi:MAG: alanine racemase [Bacillota bacterium]|nr:alanine racemase [Bacillota bacterium]